MGNRTPCGRVKRPLLPQAELYATDPSQSKERRATATACAPSRSNALCLPSDLGPRARFRPETCRLSADCADYYATRGNW